MISGNPDGRPAAPQHGQRPGRTSSQLGGVDIHSLTLTVG
jgi:hypothetical protein